MATIEDFQKLEIRVGRIIEVQDFPKARKPLYQLKIDFGDQGVKRSAAGLKKDYSKKSLLHREIVAVVNFPPRQVVDFLSECLVLAAVQRNGKIVLLRPDQEAELGSRIA